MSAAPNAIVSAKSVTIPNWAWPAMLAAIGTLWAVTFEGGALSNAISDTGTFLHEFFHDGRHLLGAPCH